MRSLKPNAGVRNVFLVWILLLAAVGLVSNAYAKEIPNFSFIQASDVHAPNAKSQEVISQIKSLDQIDMAAFDTKAPKPEFAVVTGDLTEFGGGSGWWEQFLSYWADCGIPVYYQLGNHDNTWAALVKRLRELGFGPYYSFDRNGCHFVGLMTATVQDPRPSIGEEQIRWLEKDLASLDMETPVFVFFHHPIGGTEFASRFDYDRLLDILRTRNTVLLMAGHSHGHVSRPFEDFDQITGGSTYGPNDPGLTFIYVENKVVKVAYQKAGEPSANIKILQKAIPPTRIYPVVEILSPQPREAVGQVLQVSAYTDFEGVVAKASCTIDDELNADLQLKYANGRWTATGTVDLQSLLPGAHYLRVEFATSDRQFKKSAEFFYEPESKPTAWRVYLGASSKCTPTIANGIVYVGANDGKLWAIDAKTGKVLWTADTGAEILSQPLVVDEKVITANGLGLVQAYTLKGDKVWEFRANDAVYSSPVQVGEYIALGCNSGKLYIVEPESGRLAASNEDATYSIESKPFALGDRIYFGAWDEYIRCVDAKTGSLVWKQMGEGSRTKESPGVRRYYSPADAGPVVTDNKVFAADRDYMLTILNAATGERIDAKTGVAAAGLSEDGKFIYLRKTNGNLEKITPSGEVVWSTPCKLGYIPAAPFEKNGVVYVASGLGLVSAVSASDGKILWQYQASPKLYVMSSVVSDGERAYVTAFDGMLTAIKCIAQ
ncbi:MAG: PQQ-binding-like beta-propeller repeat protein [Armatimonadota bacterium]|nr:PQQ-binding-like beta-propeller repeat protein [Armatimonadota bacterium]